MEFLWLWAFSLKTPISVICGISILGCFLSWLSARAQRSDQDFTTLHIGIIIAVFWAFIYGLPSPTYNIKTVIKEVPKPYPVVRKYIAQKQIITRTVVQRYTQDSRFNYCIDQKTKPLSQEEMDGCLNFAKQYIQPRVVVQRVNVPVYSGIQVKTVMYTRDARIRWCIERVSSNLDYCISEAKKIEAPAQIQVRVEHDPYLKLFQECNNVGAIKDSDPRPAAIRNERLKICTDMALRGSR